MNPVLNAARSSITLWSVALAAPIVGLALLPQPATANNPRITPALAQNVAQGNASNRPLPRLVDLAVRRDVARRSNQAVEQLQITRYTSDIWPNGCLGLAIATEVCTQSRVSGWRVLVSSPGNSQPWIYRTNASGRILRLESAPPSLGATDKDTPPREDGITGAASTTTTSPLPEEIQAPAAQLTPQNGQIRITLSNRTNAGLTYQVIGDTMPRNLPGQESVTLQFLEVPTTLTFRRDDGGLLNVRLQPQSEEPAALEIVLEAVLDLGRDRTTLTVEQTGAVFLN
ncbi:MAG: hypothetical protein HC771_02295 [Synechococcales cyanobacterium CRU_2_2]|nr:hypothetical protein [Synechococcales cyanobacterium CRU_2_2]